jgi:predicted dehydrogenase
MHRVVLVGCGYWGKNWYNTLTKLPGVEVVAVIDPNPVIKVENQYDSLASFDAACLEYTHAIIAVQAEFHKSYTKYFKAKLGGSKVLVEKPCGLLSEPREQYYDCYPGYLFLSTAHYKRIKNMLEEKMLGKILYSHFWRASMGPRIRTDVSIIEDYMIHDLYIYQDLFGYRPGDLYAVVNAEKQLGEEIKPSTATVKIINPENNHESTFFSSWIYPLKERKIVIVGTEGSIVWEGDKLYFTRSHYSKIEGNDKYGNKGWELKEHATVEITPEEKRSTLELEFEDFINQEPRAQIQKDLGELLEMLVTN